MEVGTRVRRTWQPLTPDNTGTVINAIGGIRAGEDVDGEWCLPVAWDDGRRGFIRVNDLDEWEADHATSDQD